MKAPDVRTAAIVVGWILVVGGLIASIDMLLHAWRWRSLLSIIEGPGVTVAVGLILWLNARR